MPAAITAGLRRRGIQVTTSQEDGTTESPDDQLLARATELGCVLFTQDDDLLRIAADWQTTGRGFHGVIYAHQLSAGIGRLVHDLELVLTCCAMNELANRVTYLPLK